LETREYPARVDRLRVSYVFPKLVDHPIGGYKVHYQYADGLARRGHRVTLLHPVTEAATVGLGDRLACWRARRRQHRTGRPPLSWFVFDPAVESLVLPVLGSQLLPEADVTILTAWQTAARTTSAPLAAGALLQIVYDYEFWITQPGNRDDIARALSRGDVVHVATSAVVERMLREIGSEPVATIPAGLANGEFAVDVPSEERGPVVGFARRYQPSKDPATALSAIAAIRQQVPDARFVCFGEAPHGELPPWVECLGQVSPAELRAFYNRCSVFLLTSRTEGWGLPALEAMACGTAVVSTASGGVEDFLVDDVNGVVVPVGDVARVASGAVDLLNDADRRLRLSRRAASDAAARTVEHSLDRLEALLAEQVAVHR
jgi:L-malate glycosyltransferase